MQHLEQLLKLDRLEQIAGQAKQYQEADPYPHIVIDDLLERDAVAQIMRDFPGPKDHEWLRYKSTFENDKLQSTNELKLPPSIRGVINAFNSATFVNFLQRLTGIQGIIPDPHLYGGGMHQTLPGGHLSVHVDYNRHEKWQLDRRLNLLLYLNEDWVEAWDGALQLWDKGFQRCVKRVYPVANRVVIFSTTEVSWHGHPDPLRCPPGRTRKSLALYYYSNGRPEEERAPPHETVFRGRPDERLRYASWRDVVRDVVPPVVLRTARRLKNGGAHRARSSAKPRNG